MDLNILFVYHLECQPASTLSKFLISGLANLRAGEVISKLVEVLNKKFVDVPKVKLVPEQALDVPNVFISKHLKKILKAAFIELITAEISTSAAPISIIDNLNQFLFEDFEAELANAIMNNTEFFKNKVGDGDEKVCTLEFYHLKATKDEIKKIIARVIATCEVKRKEREAYAVKKDKDDVKRLIASVTPMSDSEDSKVKKLIREKLKEFQALSYEILVHALIRGIIAYQANAIAKALNDQLLYSYPAVGQNIRYLSLEDAKKEETEIIAQIAEAEEADRKIKEELEDTAKAYSDRAIEAGESITADGYSNLKTYITHWPQYVAYSGMVKYHGTYEYRESIWNLSASAIYAIGNLFTTTVVDASSLQNVIKFFKKNIKAAMIKYIEDQTAKKPDDFLIEMNSLTSQYIQLLALMIVSGLDLFAIKVVDPRKKTDIVIAVNTGKVNKETLCTAFNDCHRQLTEKLATTLAHKGMKEKLSSTREVGSAGSSQGPSVSAGTSPAGAL